MEAQSPGQGSVVASSVATEGFLDHGPNSAPPPLEMGSKGECRCTQRGASAHPVASGHPVGPAAPGDGTRDASACAHAERVVVKRSRCFGPGHFVAVGRSCDITPVFLPLPPRTLTMLEGCFTDRYETSRSSRILNRQITAHPLRRPIRELNSAESRPH